ncbi:MAG: hypothetical protein HOV80_15715 [Polyangiaceae bacterium]|nr:hypothetical protein [Polyangiaceae bacterium]
MPPSTRACSVLGTVLIASFSTASGCSSDPEPVALEASFELLDGFSYDTGKLPGSGPVQVSLVVSGSAVANVHLPAVASDASGDPALHAAGPGTIEISGGFALDGTLKVDQSGLPGYDGDIPGLADINLPISGSASVESFGIGAPATVSAAITPGDLPPIPLPGGVPGKLQLSVAEGSTVDVSLEGICATFDDGDATYQGTAVRGGTINIGIAVELEIPITGSKKFDIATVGVPIPESSYEVAASASDVTMADAPEGSSAAPACASAEEAGAGGAGEGGGDAGSTTATGGPITPACSTDEECGSGQGCSSQGECKPLTTVCVNQTVRVDKLHLVKGDREFGANGPLVMLQLFPGVNAEGITVQAQLTMTELGSDQSTGTATTLFSFPAAVDSVHMTPVELVYTDSNTTPDDAAGPDAFPFASCMGDTPGEDICDEPVCSYCEFQVGCFAVIEL